MLLWNKCTLGDMEAGGAERKREMKECGCSITVFIAVCRHGWPFLSAVCVMEAVSDDSDQMFEKPWAQETLKTTLTVQNQSRLWKCHEHFFLSKMVLFTLLGYILKLTGIDFKHDSRERYLMHWPLWSNKHHWHHQLLNVTSKSFMLKKGQLY